MRPVNVEALPKKKLAQLARMYSRNWQTLDGLWFKNVEAACGLETAVSIDLENWAEQAVIEARRIKDIMELRDGSLADVLTVLSLMSWQLTSPLPICEEETPSRVIIHYAQCAVQESRAKQEKAVFPCKEMKLGLLSSIAGVAAPGATVSCLSCPPDVRQAGYWCKWQLSLKGGPAGAREV